MDGSAWGYSRTKPYYVKKNKRTQSHGLLESYLTNLLLGVSSSLSLFRFSRSKFFNFVNTEKSTKYEYAYLNILIKMRGVQAAWADPLEEERKSGQYAFYTIYMHL